MLLSWLVGLPLVGVVAVANINSYREYFYAKLTSLTIGAINFIISLFIFIMFHNSTNQFQFVQEHYNVQNFDLYLGVDIISIYFVLLTTIIMPIALLSNWNSIKENVKSYLIVMLLLESLLLIVFMASDIMLFYIFFESILPPLFLLIGIFGSNNKVKASYYLFLLLSILCTSSFMGSTDLDVLFQLEFDYKFQIFLFIGIFIAFAVKTPTIFLNNWLLKAHVESPLGGSIVLAGIVLKLSLYGVFRLILPILPDACLDYTFIVYTISVITILYASISTIRTTDIKELIAYSSVCHAAVYLIGVFSNTIQGLEGSIVLGLAHGFVSSGLFICAGGILYDRTHTRVLYYYRGIAQLMPIFAVLFFILSLGNCGAPLTLNFIGEFMSLYGIIEKLSILGVFAATSIIFSAAYTIYMYNRISFGGSFTQLAEFGLLDVNKREFLLLFILVLFTIVLGIYPSIILNLLDYSMNSLIFSIH
jgi:NADH-ubiquinone oxidoreductase chain 4